MPHLHNVTMRRNRQLALYLRVVLANETCLSLNLPDKSIFPHKSGDSPMGISQEIFYDERSIGMRGIAGVSRGSRQDW